jgi:hypothetical protein
MSYMKQIIKYRGLLQPVSFIANDKFRSPLQSVLIFGPQDLDPVYPSLFICFRQNKEHTSQADLLIYSTKLNFENINFQKEIFIYLMNPS